MAPSREVQWTGGLLFLASAVVLWLVAPPGKGLIAVLTSLTALFGLVAAWFAIQDEREVLLGE